LTGRMQALDALEQNLHKGKMKFLADQQKAAEKATTDGHKAASQSAKERIAAVEKATAPKSLAEREAETAALKPESPTEHGHDLIVRYEEALKKGPTGNVAKIEAQLRKAIAKETGDPAAADEFIASMRGERPDNIGFSGVGGKSGMSPQETVQAEMAQAGGEEGGGEPTLTMHGGSATGSTEPRVMSTVTTTGRLFGGPAIDAALPVLERNNWMTRGGFPDKVRAIVARHDAGEPLPVKELHDLVKTAQQNIGKLVQTSKFKDLAKSDPAGHKAILDALEQLKRQGTGSKKPDEGSMGMGGGNFDWRKAIAEAAAQGENDASGILQDAHNANPALNRGLSTGASTGKLNYWLDKSKYGPAATTRSEQFINEIFKKLAEKDKLTKASIALGSYASWKKAKQAINKSKE